MVPITEGHLPFISASGSRNTHERKIPSALPDAPAMLLELFI